MEPLFLLLIVVLIGAVLLAFLRSQGTRGDPGPEAFPFERRPLFTAAERSFLGVLEQAVGEQVRVLGKVRLGDLVKVRPGLPAGPRKSAQNRVQSKHVDFVLCTREHRQILAVIEIDARSHRAPAQQKRDAGKDGVMAAANIPIHRFPAKTRYSVHDVRQALSSLRPEVGRRHALAERMGDVDEAASDPSPAVHSVEENVCPRCGSDLVERVAKRGPQQGTAFFGCSAYPRCRYTVMEAAT